MAGILLTVKNSELTDSVALSGENQTTINVGTKQAWYAAIQKLTLSVYF